MAEQFYDIVFGTDLTAKTICDGRHICLLTKKFKLYFNDVPTAYITIACETFHDGYILNGRGPFPATTSDATAMKNILDNKEDALN